MMALLFFGDASFWFGWILGYADYDEVQRSVAMWRELSEALEISNEKC
jgi:hypothetical protein